MTLEGGALVLADQVRCLKMSYTCWFLFNNKFSFLFACFAKIGVLLQSLEESPVIDSFCNLVLV
jgi:hypothetical protein